MANVVITSSMTAVTVVFNGLDANLASAVRRIAAIDSVELHGVGSRKGDYVQMNLSDGSAWFFSNENGRGYTVDTVDGAEKATNVLLASALAALL